MNTKRPFDLSALRQRLAVQHGYHFRQVREPGEFAHSAEIIGLTPTDLGYDRCAIVLNRLRAVADTATHGEYALSVVRDPRTRDRRGYAVYTQQQAVADQIATAIRSLLP